MCHKTFASVVHYTGWFRRKYQYFRMWYYLLLWEKNYVYECRKTLASIVQYTGWFSRKFQYFRMWYYLLLWEKSLCVCACVRWSNKSASYTRVQIIGCRILLPTVKQRSPMTLFSPAWTFVRDLWDLIILRPKFPLFWVRTPTVIGMQLAKFRSSVLSHSSDRFKILEAVLFPVTSRRHSGSPYFVIIRYLLLGGPR